jgi:hypothetical protein
VPSLSRLVLPLAALDRIEIAPHSAYANVTVVRFGAGSSTMEVAVPDESAAHRLVAGAAARTGTAA